jgi:hypothetical protein
LYFLMRALLANHLFYGRGVAAGIALFLALA